MTGKRERLGWGAAARAVLAVPPARLGLAVSRRAPGQRTGLDLVARIGPQAIRRLPHQAKWRQGTHRSRLVWPLAPGPQPARFRMDQASRIGPARERTERRAGRGEICSSGGFPETRRRYQKFWFSINLCFRYRNPPKIPDMPALSAPSDYFCISVPIRPYPSRACFASPRRTAPGRHSLRCRGLMCQSAPPMPPTQPTATAHCHRRGDRSSRKAEGRSSGAALTLLSPRRRCAPLGQRRSLSRWGRRPRGSGMSMRNRPRHTRHW